VKSGVKREECVSTNSCLAGDRQTFVLKQVSTISTPFRHSVGKCALH